MTTVRVLIMEANPPPVRERIVALGGVIAADIYRHALAHSLPGIVTDVFYAADADAGLPQGADLDQYDGIVWSGSALNIYHDDPAVTRQLTLAEQVYASGVPWFGSCWGLQVAVVAAGGEVILNPRGREIGLARKIHLTPAGREHPIYRDKAPVFDSVCVHQDDTLHLPAGATVLAENAISPVQAVEIRRGDSVFCGVQYHPEFDLDYVSRICLRMPEALIQEGFFADHAAVNAHVERLQTLHRHPERRDLAWQLGVDADVLDPNRRYTEIRNWLQHYVVPRRKRS